MNLIQKKQFKQKIVPHLWFDDQAKEAASFYVDVFNKNPFKLKNENSEVGKETYYVKSTEEVSGKPAGSIMTVDFIINGQNFLALNGGPDFKFNESISFMVNCKNQQEIDYFWEKLSEGGDPKSQICGWLKDKYGLSWQIVPESLEKIFNQEDSEKQEKVMAVFLKMGKITIADLEKATSD
ncbi:MAG: VOC family protein [Candidatus Pacebacteria bacterium]|nr:VOC family protein [Candidatus Paceibacterota bacterium]